MKKYTRSTAKGFTLVELIVVIVILSILATIAFLSFTSQSASARDSKRKTDISGITSKVNVFLAQKGNGAIMQLVTPVVNRALTSPSIAGQSGTLASTYQAGVTNYANLGISPTDFLDTNSGGTAVGYALGVTTLQGTAYQLASRLEVDEAGNTVTNMGYVMGSYVARGNTGTDIVAGSGTVVGTTATVTLPSNKAGFFKTGDVISDGTNTGSVTAVSNNGTLSVTMTAGFSAAVNVKLFAPEVTGLIKSENGPNPVSSTNAPY